ncbi:MAG TPA: pantoate--beta-alanine ligase [Anaeromyxobacteraceae bacterium]|nr:pantoate--beta-alanine ligase [Anaeromyxobacteraceae bacterium]
MTAELIVDPRQWQCRCSLAREAGRRIALVPTMGFLHAGHMALMHEARRRADERADPPGSSGKQGSWKGGLALATIFVNPTQFGPGEDLARYPRDLEGDLAKCSSAGIDWVLAPEGPGRVFAENHETWVTVERTSTGLCGKTRPDHFRGVATVVAKLLNLTRPQVAVFGEKDWQQLQVIRAMVRDLDFEVEVLGVPIVREEDGLARSSRNTYLSAVERQTALALSRALLEAQARVGQGERDALALRSRAAQVLEAAGARVDYVEVVEGVSLRRVERVEPGSRMLVAAFVGATRLIDNVALS